MTIEQLGNIGEFVAAILVLISLVYLAIQVRQNTIELKAAAYNEVFQAYSNFRRSIYSDPQLSTLIAKAVASEPLTDEEQHRYWNFLNECLFITLNLGRNMNPLKIDDFEVASWNKSVESVAIYLSNESGRVYWDEWKVLFPKDYQEEVDSAMQRLAT